MNDALTKLASAAQRRKEAADRDAITRRALDDIAAGRTLSVEEFEREMDAFLDRLDDPKRA